MHACSSNPFYEYELNRHNRNNRKRVVGAGRKFDESLARRTVGVLAYLRLHTSQTVIATMFGLQQYEISRDLRRLLPLIRDVLPCLELWDRIRIEYCIGWIKNWAIIATRFRCSHSIYGLVMQTICGLVNQQTLRRQRATGVSTYCA